MAHPASHKPASHRPAADHDHDIGHDDGIAEKLDLDAQLFAGYLSAVTGLLARLAGDGAEHIVDLGAGTGTGTFALLERFPSARVTAVDSSPAMLARLTGTAKEKGLADRVRVVEADAGAGLPGVTGADLVWASASLHHVADPAAALAGITAALRPGGLLAVAELDGLPRFLPDDAVPGRPGLEARCRAALTAVHEQEVPHLGADWGARLTAAGFTVEEEQVEQVELRAPLPEGTSRYAHVVLSRLRADAADRVDAADLAALDSLLGGGPLDVRHRDDLVVHSKRELWVARRPTV